MIYLCLGCWEALCLDFVLVGLIIMDMKCCLSRLWSWSMEVTSTGLQEELIQLLLQSACGHLNLETLWSLVLYTNPCTWTVLLLPFSETPPFFSSWLSAVDHLCHLSHIQAALPAVIHPSSFQTGHFTQWFRVFSSPISEEIQPLQNWADGSEFQRVDTERCFIPTSWMSAVTAKEGQGNCCFLCSCCVVEMLPFLMRAKG